MAAGGCNEQQADGGNAKHIHLDTGSVGAVSHRIFLSEKNHSENCAHFCAHPTHRSVTRDCQFWRMEGPEAFEDSRHIATLRNPAVPPLSL
jgi:hypothetical protein